MNTRVKVPVDVLVSRVHDFLATSMPSVTSEWAELFDTEWLEDFSGNLAEKMHWVDLYRRRQEDSFALGTGLADALAKVVRELSEFDGDRLILVLASARSNTYFVWLSPDLSYVVSCFRSRDKRQLESGGAARRNDGD